MNVLRDNKDSHKKREETYSTKRSRVTSPSTSTTSIPQAYFKAKKKTRDTKEFKHNGNFSELYHIAKKS